MKSLSRLSKILLSGVLGFSALFTSAGCINPTIPQVKVSDVENESIDPNDTKISYKKIPRIPLEQELISHIRKKKFSITDAVFMATGLNEWEYQEFQRTLDSKIEKIKQTKRFQEAKTIPEKARIIFETTEISKGYDEKISNVVSTMGRTGNCMGATLYTSMACEEEGINLTPVLCSADRGKHIFVRLKHKGKNINLETTSSKGFDFKFTEKNKLNYEVEISKNQLLVEYLYNLAREANRQKSKELELAFHIASAKVLPTKRNTFETSQGVRWDYGSDNEVRMLREIYKLHPKSNIAKEALARALSFRGRKRDTKEALSLMLPIVRKGGEKNEIRYEYIGDIYRDLKNYSQAAKWYKKALEINPNSKYAKQGLEKISRKNSKKE